MLALAADGPVVRPQVEVLIAMTGIGDHEDSLRAQMAEPLAAYEKLAGIAFGLMARAQEAPDAAVGPQQLSLMAVRPILARLQGDLRAIYLLSMRGYAIPSLSLAAGIHELAFIAMYVCGNDARAREYFTHNNARRTYPPIPVEQIIADGCGRFNLPPERIAQEYSVYRQLCEAKHGNPRIQTLYGTVTFDDRQEIQQIPFFSDATVTFCKVALWFAARALTMAVLVYVLEHLSEVDGGPLARELDEHLQAMNRQGRLDGFVQLV